MAKGFRIASAYVDISADTAGLRRDARDGIVKALRGLDAKVQIHADTKGLRREVERAIKQATTGNKGKFNLGVDSTALRQQVRDAIKRATTGANGKIRLGVSDVGLRTSIERAIKKAIRGISIKIPVRAESTGLREEVRAAIAIATAGQRIQIPMRVDSRPLMGSLNSTGNAIRSNSSQWRKWLAIGTAAASLLPPALGASLHALQAMAPATAVAVTGLAALLTMGGAVAVGMNGVGEAVKQSGQDAKRYKQALDRLTPSAKAFVQSIVESKGAFKGLQRDVQETLFTGMAKSMRTMAKTVIPDLRIGLGGMAMDLRDMSLGVMATTTQLSKTGVLKAFFGGLQMAMDPLVKVPGQLLNSFIKLSIAATPLFMRMTQSMGRGMDILNEKVNRGFETGRLQMAIDKSGDAIVKFFKNIGNNPEWQRFVSSLKEQGPQMAHVLANISEALLRLVNDLGPLGGATLRVAEAFSKLILALPDGAITTILSLVLAFKLIGLAGKGIIGTVLAVQRLWKALMVLRSVGAVSAAIGPALLRIGASSGAITATATAMRGLGIATAVAAAGAASFVIGYKIAHDLWGKSPQSVDAATKSLIAYGKSGDFGAENINKLNAAVSRLSGNRSTSDKIYDVGTFHKNDEWKKAIGDIDSYDKALGQLVTNGNGKLAAAGFSQLKKVLSDAGMGQKDITKYTNDYAKSLADQKAAAELAAQTMGIFGDRAVATGAKLDQLKSDTDGLAKSLFALNNVNRDAVDALGDMESAGDALTAQAKKHAGALTYQNGVISQNTQAQRDNVDALNAYAEKTQAAGLAQYQSNGNWQQSLSIWQQGHAELVKQGGQMGLNAAQAKAYADAILRIPSQKEINLQMVGQAQEQLDAVVASFEAAPSKKTITVDALDGPAIKKLKDLGYQVTKLPDGRFSVTSDSKNAKEDLKKLSAYRVTDKDIKVLAETQNAIGQLDGVIKKIKATPGSKSVTVKTLNAAAITALEAVGYKVTHLKDGSVKVTAVTGAASRGIAGIQAQRDRLSDKSITFTTHRVTIVDTLKGQSLHDVVGATGGLASTLKGFAGGGSIAGGVLKGPGTKTSDSLLAKLSRGEFVMQAAAVDKYGPRFMSLLNAGLLPKLPGFAAGGYTKKRTVGKGTKKHTEYLYQGQWMTKDAYDKAHGAANDLSGLTSFSHFGQMAFAQGSYKRNEMENQLGRPASIDSLVGDLNKYRGLIQTSTSGKTESSLLKKLDSSGKTLLAQQKKLEGVNTALDAAKDKLSDLKQSFDQLKDSVKGNILSFGNITKAGKYGTSASTLISQLQGDTNKATQFSGMLSQLKSKGVDSQILSDIASAGISGGGMATAQTLLGASDADIKKINDLQKQLTTAATSAGDTVATAMYGAGIQAAQGLVNGLTSQQAAIEAQMMAIAKSMEAAIKKALGIKSPSRVMMKVADFTADGLVNQLATRRAEVRSSMQAIIPTPAGLTAMATTPATASVPAPRGGGDIHIGAININGAGIDMSNPAGIRQMAKLIGPAVKEEIRLSDKRTR